MDTIQAIMTRRSIRQFTDAPVSSDDVTTMLRAGMAAPSAGNEQPWEFIVIRDRDTMQRIANVHPYAKMTAEAPVGILIAGDKSREKHKGFWVQDASAATQNILLAAHALGYGAVWCGIYPDSERCTAFNKLFSLPEHVFPFALINVGVAQKDLGPVDRYDASRVHQETW